MMFFKRLVSFIYPIVLERFSSKVSGTLELGMQNGKLVLDTGNANYSYGNLHLVFREVVKEFTFTNDKKDVLILGFGAGSIASILNKEKKLNLKIDGVDLDEQVLVIYDKYFSWNDKNIRIFNEDVICFLDKNTKKYDYIFIDVFQNLSVPKPFLTSSFIKLLREASHDETQLAMNIISNKVAFFEEKWLRILGEKTYVKEYFDLNTVIFHIPEKYSI